MRKNMQKTIMLLLMLTTVGIARAQETSAVEVLSQCANVLNKLSKEFVAYQSLMAHSDNPRKAERKRQELANEVTEARQSLAGIPYYKGDKTLHQSFSEYLKLVDYNLNEDYSKLVNMKDIADQSYDKMEAYILFKEKLSEKMESGSAAVEKAQREYAQKYNITIEEKESELDKQIAKINEVTKYIDDLYLVFFKCSVLNEDLMEAIEKKNVNSIEQLRNAMKSFADEGLATLDTMKAYRGDASLINACKRAMTFFQKEAERSADYSQFITKEETFNRLKAQFESDKEMRKDKTAVDNYNQAVKAMNDAVNTYNNTNNYLNKYRAETYDYWNDANKVFLDRHIPVAH